MFHKLIVPACFMLVSLLSFSCDTGTVKNSHIMPPSTTNMEELILESGVENITISPQTRIERRVRNAAVKITGKDLSGHGSGSYFIYRGFHLVITAYHVVDEIDPQHIVVIGKDRERVEAHLLYADAHNDIAVIQLKNVLESRNPMPLTISQNEPLAGDVLTYTGFPNGHEMLTFQGRIAGFENVRDNRHAILIHTYGWFGSSGSCLFNERGQLVAILWGVDVEVFVMPQAQEDLIYASAADVIDMNKVILQACRHTQSSRPICRRALENDILQRFRPE